MYDLSHASDGPEMRRPFTLIDLFAGAGLFSAGLMKAGFRPVLAVDAAADAVASYNRNVAPCAVKGSVVVTKGVRPCDVLVAGPPCQGFSTLGRRDPTDVRNSLGLAILPWVEASRPLLVVVENVPPFLRSKQWRQMADGLAGLGYSDVTTWELDAADFGTPQRRKRAFTIASLIGPVAPPEPGRRNMSAGRAIMVPPPSDGDPMHVWPVKTGKAAARIAMVPPRGGRRDLVRQCPELCPPSWIKLGGDATDVYGRIDPDVPSNTLRCEFLNPSKGRYIHPYEDRVLSLREGARLQGVPDDWVFEGKPWQVARQIGNGVPLPLGRAVGTVLARALKDHLARQPVAA
ncbi:DNA cytosine methyltransferase [Methylobacterium sp. 2A]|jgi:DNA (cytosine-5)-methyltransferase 1|nr:DNA cytosine methyltransferase [Methylobacterium sp. 2A]